jgi:hypothetical protein
MPASTAVHTALFLPAQGPLRIRWLFTEVASVVEFVGRVVWGRLDACRVSPLLAKKVQPSGWGTLRGLSIILSGGRDTVARHNCTQDLTLCRGWRCAGSAKVVLGDVWWRAWVCACRCAAALAQASVPHPWSGHSLGLEWRLHRTLLVRHHVPVQDLWTHTVRPCLQPWCAGAWSAWLTTLTGCKGVQCVRCGVTGLTTPSPSPPPSPR